MEERYPMHDYVYEADPWGSPTYRRASRKGKPMRESEARETVASALEKIDMGLDRLHIMFHHACGGDVDRVKLDVRPYLEMISVEVKCLVDLLSKAMYEGGSFDIEYERLARNYEELRGKYDDLKGILKATKEHYEAGVYNPDLMVDL